MGWKYVVFNALLNSRPFSRGRRPSRGFSRRSDARTGRKIYTRTSFFFVCRFLIPGIWGIAALATVGGVDNTLEAMPRYLSAAVPAGVIGIVIAAMLAADMSTDSSYMLTWSSVIYNDILAPFRKGPWSEKRGLFWNRSIVAFIGVFLLLYGLWYPLKGDLWTYLGVTGTIYLASISVLLIASLLLVPGEHVGRDGRDRRERGDPLELSRHGASSEHRRTRPQDRTVHSGIAAYVGSAAAMVVGSLIRPRSQSESTLEV